MESSAFTPRQRTFAFLIFLQALVATLGSLYFSTYGDPVKNVLSGTAFPSHSGFPPCELCWFARILMYPMVPIAFIGLAREDKAFVYYLIPLVLLGIPLDFYHYGLQKLNFPNPFNCTAANPCSALQVNYLGFITIPLLALTAFCVIGFCIVMFLKSNKQAIKEE